MGRELSRIHASKRTRLRKFTMCECAYCGEIILAGYVLMGGEPMHAECREAMDAEMYDENFDEVTASVLAVFSE